MVAKFATSNKQVHGRICQKNKPIEKKITTLIILLSLFVLMCLHIFSFVSNFGVVTGSGGSHEPGGGATKSIPDSVFELRSDLPRSRQLA